MSREEQINPKELWRSTHKRLLYDERTRKARAHSLLSDGKQPSRIDERTFSVPSQSSKDSYVVEHLRGWNCTCKDFRNYRKDCKHVFAVKFWLVLESDAGQHEPSEGISPLKICCVYCNSEDIVQRGRRKTKARISKQRYGCSNCGRRFVLDPAKGLKANARLVTLTMDLYFKGLSLRDISDTLYQFYNIDVHFVTIKRWILGFAKRMIDHVKELKPELGDIWHADEQMIKSKKKWRWCWNVIDAKTRFLIANNVTSSRHVKDAQKIMQKAKVVAGKSPQVFVTDGLQAYRRAARKEFDTHQRRLSKPVHLFNAGVKKKDNNNLIERYHNEFREFDKVRRGFKSDKTASEWSEAFQLYHNFVKKHETLRGMTPAEVAGINLRGGKNRWANLLKL